MAWGVLEVKEHKVPKGGVPGTALLDKPIEHNFKRRGEIILVPQPSDSPNDPLNWTQSKKNIAMCILGFAAAMALSMMTMLGPGFRPMSAYYHVSFDQLSTYMIGVVILCTGTTTFFSAAASSVWGKRPVFLVSTVFLLVCCVWGFAATSFTSLAVMRAFSGVAAAPLETLVKATIYDMFFVHERGKKLSIWGIMFLSGMHVNSLIFSLIIDKTGPVVYVPPMKKLPKQGGIPGFNGTALNGTESRGHMKLPRAEHPKMDFKEMMKIPGLFTPQYLHMGIKWAFFACAIIWLIVLLLIYFFVPETVYVRRVKAINPETIVEKNNVEIVERSDSDTSLDEKMTRKEELRIFRGRVTQRRFWKCVFQPIPLIVFPAVIFSTVVYGAFMAWLVILHTIQFNVLSKPPHSLRPLMLGVIGLPAWGVSLITMPIAGFSADWLIKVMAKRNKGVFEPEFRLWLMIPACVISSISFIGFGWAVQNNKSTPLVVLFSTLQSGAIPFASASSLLYVIDCHPENANEAFVIINLFKALVIFFASLKTNGWYEKAGAKAVFDTITVLNVSVSLLTIPIYIFGKRFRALVARNKTLERWVSVH